jgi:hypothetical protein
MSSSSGAAPATESMRPESSQSSASIARWRVLLGRRGVSTLAALAIFALLTLGYFNPVLRGYTFSLVSGHSSIQYPWAAHPSHYHDGVQSDQANNDYPIQANLNKSLREGTFPYWSDYSFGGGPTLGTVYGVSFYPPRVAASLVVSPSWVHDLLVIFHVWLAGAAMFLLVRRLGCSWIAGLLAGVAWMFSPSWFGLALLEGSAILAGLLPLCLWLVHRAVIDRSVRDAVGAGAALALIVLGASVQPAVFCFGVAGLWGLLLGLRGPLRSRPWRDALTSNVKIVAENFKLVAGYTILGVALCAFLVLPETAQISTSARAPITEATMNLQRVSLSMLDRVIDATPPSISGETIWTLTFLGLPIVVAAVAGCFSRRPGTGLGRSIVVVFFLMMGGTFLTEIARAVVPGFAFISPLGRLLPFFAFGAILLAAIGVDTLGGLARRWLRFPLAMPIVIAIAVLAVSAEAWQSIKYDRDVNPPFQPRTASQLYPKTPLIASLQRSRDRVAAEGNEQRILPVRPGAPTDPFTPPPFVGETPLLFGLENAGGYLNVIPQRSQILTHVLAGGAPNVNEPLIGAYLAFFYSKTARFDLLQKMGVDAVVTTPNPTKEPGFLRAIRTTKGKVTYSGADGAVIEVPETRRAFVVDGVETARGASAALARYISPSFDVQRAVLLDGSFATGVKRRPGTGPVDAQTRILRTGESERRIEVDSPHAGWLVLLDSYSKGWSAKVNGKSSALDRADFAYRAVRVPAGHSVVTMRYQTPGLRSGVAISLLALLIAVGLLVRPDSLAPLSRRLKTRLRRDGGSPADSRA